jgi:hypothetical protein
MPRYYFQVCNGDGFKTDEDGQDLPDIHAARATAITGLRDILASELKDGVLKMASFIEIEDENRALLMTVPFIEAVMVEERPVRDALMKGRAGR